jgi:hypothetical protein
MKQNILPLFNFSNGAFIMIVIFGLVVIGLVSVVFLLMNTDKKKKSN